MPIIFFVCLRAILFTLRVLDFKGLPAKEYSKIPFLQWWYDFIYAFSWKETSKLFFALKLFFLMTYIMLFIFLMRYLHHLLFVFFVLFFTLLLIYGLLSICTMLSSCVINRVNLWRYWEYGFLLFACMFAIHSAFKFNPFFKKNVGLYILISCLLVYIMIGFFYLLEKGEHYLYKKTFEENNIWKQYFEMLDTFSNFKDLFVQKIFIPFNYSIFVVCILILMYFLTLERVNLHILTKGLIPLIFVIISIFFTTLDKEPFWISILVALLSCITLALFQKKRAKTYRD